MSDIYCNQSDCISINKDGKCIKDIIVLDDLLYNGIPRINEFKCRYYKQKEVLHE